MTFCTFRQYDPHHVRCVQCGRRLSGKPEDYDGRIECKANNSNVEGERMGCCGKSRQASVANSRYGEKVMVKCCGAQVAENGSNFIKVTGKATNVVYGYKVVTKPFCLYKTDADAEPESYETIGPCK